MGKTPARCRGSNTASPPPRLQIEHAVDRLGALVVCNTLEADQSPATRCAKCRHSRHDLERTAPTLSDRGQFPAECGNRRSTKTGMLLSSIAAAGMLTRTNNNSKLDLLPDCNESMI